jgi:hypothetical protein
MVKKTKRHTSIKDDHTCLGTPLTKFALIQLFKVVFYKFVLYLESGKFHLLIKN